MHHSLPSVCLTTETKPIHVESPNLVQRSHSGPRTNIRNSMTQNLAVAPKPSFTTHKPIPKRVQNHEKKLINTNLLRSDRPISKVEISNSGNLFYTEKESLPSIPNTPKLDPTSPKSNYFFIPVKPEYQNSRPSSSPVEVPESEPRNNLTSCIRKYHSDTDFTISQSKTQNFMSSFTTTGSRKRSKSLSTLKNFSNYSCALPENYATLEFEEVLELENCGLVPEEKHESLKRSLSVDQISVNSKNLISKSDWLTETFTAMNEKIDLLMSKINKIDISVVKENKVQPEEHENIENIEILESSSNTNHLILNTRKPSKELYKTHLQNSISEGQDSKISTKPEEIKNKKAHFFVYNWPNTVNLYNYIKMFVQQPNQIEIYYLHQSTLPISKKEAHLFMQNSANFESRTSFSALPESFKNKLWLCFHLIVDFTDKNIIESRHTWPLGFKSPKRWILASASLEKRGRSIAKKVKRSQRYHLQHLNSKNKSSHSGSSATITNAIGSQTNTTVTASEGCLTPTTSQISVQEITSQRPMTEIVETQTIVMTNLDQQEIVKSTSSVSTVEENSKFKNEAGHEKPKIPSEHSAFSSHKSCQGSAKFTPFSVKQLSIDSILNPGSQHFVAESTNILHRIQEQQKQQQSRENTNSTIQISDLPLETVTSPSTVNLTEMIQNNKSKSNNVLEIMKAYEDRINNGPKYPSYPTPSNSLGLTNVTREDKKRQCTGDTLVHADSVGNKDESSTQTEIKETESAQPQPHQTDITQTPAPAVNPKTPTDTHKSLENLPIQPPSNHSTVQLHKSNKSINLSMLSDGLVDSPINFSSSKSLDKKTFLTKGSLINEIKSLKESFKEYNQELSESEEAEVKTTSTFKSRSENLDETDQPISAQNSVMQETPPEAASSQQILKTDTPILLRKQPDKPLKKIPVQIIQEESEDNMTDESENLKGVVGHFKKK